MAQENLLEVKNLVVRYGGIEAVRGISFEVPKGQIVTLIGSNGAGKSSTLRAITGLEKPVAGSIVFEGQDLTKLGTETIVTRGITLVPEGRRVFVNLTVAENLRMGAYMRKDDFSKDLEWVAGDCEGPDEQAGSGHDGRAVPGTGPDHRPGSI